MHPAQSTTFQVCVAFLAVAGCSVPSAAQSPSERPIYSRLSTKSADSIKALDEVLSQSEVYSALILYQAAAVAVVTGRNEDSGFLFYAAQIRVPFEKAAYPALPRDLTDYVGVYGMLRAVIGPRLMPLLYDNPKTFEKALDRVDTWAPRASKDHEPGWKYTSRVDTETAATAIRSNRAKFMMQMHGFCTLLQNDQYRAAFRTAQDNNPTTIRAGDKAPTREEFLTAMTTMQRIENETKIPGMSGQFKA